MEAVLYWIVGKIIKGYSPLILGQLYRIARDSNSVSGHIHIGYVSDHKESVG